MLREWLICIAVVGALGSCAAPDPFEATTAAVRQSLRNGETAKFQKLERCGKGDIVKGEVNAENAYGGFTGYQMFVEERGTVALEENSTAFVEMLKRCTAAIYEGISGPEPP